jgi:hypothetical protein
MLRIADHLIARGAARKRPATLSHETPSRP